MQTFDNYIGGRQAPPASGEYFESENPFTARPWARVARGNAEDVDRAVAAARAAFTGGAWPALTASERGALLGRLADLVAGNVDMLSAAESRDNGKTITEMRGQIRNVAEWYRFYAGLADKLNGEVIPTERRNHLNYTRHEPLGVCALIIPWNSPLRLLSWKLAPALAAGNTVVIKPSEFTSTSASVFIALVEKAGFPPGVVNLVTGFGADVGRTLVEHPDVAKVAFTGGETGGIAVYTSAASKLKPVSLELGGKSPNIIFADAHLENAARGAVAGIFASCGQSCVAGSRLVVHRGIRDAIVARVSELAQKIRMGDPMDEATEMGPIANRQQYDRILRYIDIARNEGATLQLGGGPATRPECGDGLFIEPTIFVDVDNKMRIAQEEVFGPVLSVITFDDEDEAVRIANDTPYGLGSGIWTDDLKRAHRVAARIQAGSVWINTYRISSQLSPFGGYKRSGFGREGGAEMLKSYTQTKSVWLDLNADFPYPFKGH
jgi:aldehyde dehydrogenase (NAD+)